MAKAAGDQSQMTDYEVNAGSQDHGLSICNMPKLAHLFPYAFLLLQIFTVRTQKLTVGGCSDGSLQLNRDHPAGC